MRKDKFHYHDLIRDLLEHLAKIKLGNHEYRVLMAIARQTWGWQKDSDWISPKLLNRLTGITRRNCSKAALSLRKKNIIKRSVISRYDKSKSFLAITNSFDAWKVKPSDMTRKTPDASSPGMHNVFSWEDETSSSEKHTSIKQQALLLQTNLDSPPEKSGGKKSTPKRKAKTSYSDRAHHIAHKLLDSILSWKPNFKPPTESVFLNQWVRPMDQAMRLDNRSIDELLDLIQWVKEDDFWRGNILSGQKLRKQFDQVQARMMGEQKKKSPAQRPTCGRCGAYVKQGMKYCQTCKEILEEQARRK